MDGSGAVNPAVTTREAINTASKIGKENLNTLRDLMQRLRGSRLQALPNEAVEEDSLVATANSLVTDAQEINALLNEMCIHF